MSKNNSKEKAIPGINALPTEKNDPAFKKDREFFLKHIKDVVDQKKKQK